MTTPISKTTGVIAPDAYVSFDSSGNIIQSSGVDSVVSTGTGLKEITWTEEQANTDYGIQVSIDRGNSTNSYWGRYALKTTTTVQIITDSGNPFTFVNSNSAATVTRWNIS